MKRKTVIITIGKIGVGTKRFGLKPPLSVRQILRRSGISF